MTSDAIDTQPPLDRLATTIDEDSSGIVGLLVVAGIAIVGSYLLWTPFAQPLAIIADVLPTKTCEGNVAGTSEMRSCAAQAGFIKMLGPMALGVGIFFARKPLTRWTQTAAQKLPRGLQPLVAPLLAVALFLLVWAGTHNDSSEQAGLLPQKAFPALIGVYAYAVMRWGQSLQARMPRFLDARDKLPFLARLAITLGIPTVTSFLITNQDRVSDSALKEQFVVVLGLALAYLLLLPRGDQINAMTTQLLGKDTR